VTAYRVDAAPPGRACDSWQHDGRRIAAVVATEDGAWCLLHWLPVAEHLRQGGDRIDYTPAARLALRLSGRK
jgi:hypothetical protein